jgi:uncharacterized protein involved in exopolysaccharide biosynthesis
MNEGAVAQTEGELIDLGMVFAELSAKRLWIAGITLLATIAFAIAAFTMRPVYRASTLLVSASAERDGLGQSIGSTLGQLGGIASLAGVSLHTGDASTDEALAVLRSREFTGRFIDDRKLMPVLFADRWNPATRTWKDDSKQPTPADAYKYFDRRIRSVLQDKKTGFVTLQIDWFDSNVAAEWANDLVNRLNAEMRSRAIAKTDASLGYLEKELGTTQTIEVRDAINRLVETQIKQRMLANVTQEFSFRVVDHAVPPDRDDRLRPNKVLLLVVGPVLGLVVGVIGVLLTGSLANARRSQGRPMPAALSSGSRAR